MYRSGGGRYGDNAPQSKVYVGDIGNNATERDLEDAFSSYGTIKHVWIAQNPPGFAFVEFEDSRDAEDAVKGMDGSTICGRQAKVEMARGRRRGGGGGRGGGFGGRGGGGYGGGGGGFGGRRGGGGGGGGDSKCYECGEYGHFARECRNSGGGGGGYRDSRRRSRSRSR